MIRDHERDICRLFSVEELNILERTKVPFPWVNYFLVKFKFKCLVCVLDTYKINLVNKFAVNANK